MTPLVRAFREFFPQYQSIWNKCSADEMNAMLAQDLRVRWAYTGNKVSDWGYQEACDGWREAYRAYQGKNPRWHFKEIAIVQVSESDVLATFWTRFELNGELVSGLCLFTQTFRLDDGQWKLIREYVESFTTQWLSDEEQSQVTA